jgi:hypothetical protein
MNIAVDVYSQEMRSLLEEYKSKPGLAPLRSRALHVFRTEINTVRSIGYPLKDIWRALSAFGYQGSYPQFARTCRRMLMAESVAESLRPVRESPPRTPAIQNAKTQEHAMDHSSGGQEKPAWQIHREEIMARLDREAELNRQREEQWATRKVFKMRPFVGRQAPD